MKKVTGTEFKEAIEALGFTTELPLDRFYYRPSFEWLKVYCDWCRRHPVKWEKEIRDCDNITEQQVVEADLANRLRADASNVANATDHTLVACVVDIEPGQTLNGIPGPTADTVEETGFAFARHMTGLIWCDDGDFYFVERQTGKQTYAKFAIDTAVCRPVYSRM